MSLMTLLTKHLRPRGTRVLGQSHAALNHLELVKVLAVARLFRALDFVPAVGAFAVAERRCAEPFLHAVD